MLLLFLFVQLRRPVQQPQVLKFSVYPPPALEFDGGGFALSPDGKQLAYTAAGPEGAGLRVRPFDSFEDRELAGTAGASMPFWSPDSRSIGFFADGKLKRVDAEGGTARSLANAPQPRGGSWSQTGEILFAPQSRGPLFHVSAVGGEARAASSLQNNERAHVWPSFLPDGESFVYSAIGPASDPPTLWTGSRSGQFRALIRGCAVGAWASGHLLFVRDQGIQAWGFDSARRQLLKDASPVRGTEQAGPHFSVSGNLLAFRARRSPESLQWLDRNGHVLETAADSGEAGGFALSPNGRTVALARGDLWLLDIVRSTTSRITFDEQHHESPVWSPDGTHLAFAAGGDRAGIYQMQTPAPGKPEPLLPSREVLRIDDWSRDGKWILYEKHGEKGGSELWMLPVGGQQTPPKRVLESPFSVQQGRLSPDLRWIAYVSDESGRDEVYVQSFPLGSRKWQVSNRGGTVPRWARDGREMFYLAPGQILTSVEIRMGNGLEPGIPRTLFSIRGSQDYAVTPDRQRFLVDRSTNGGSEPPIQIILNWPVTPR